MDAYCNFLVVDGFNDERSATLALCRIDFIGNGFG
jgi:hypothetical protein